MPKSYSFGDFTIDLDRGCLVRAGEEVKLRPKVYEALKYLIENNNRLVSKEELIKAIWPASFVTDDSLVQCLVEVRRALGDEAQRCIKTVPRRGYMFVAEVNPVSLPGFDETGAGEGATATPVGADVAGDFAHPQQPAVEPAALIVRKTNYTALALGITILVFVNVGLYFFFRDKRPEDDAIHSIAVMPLVNASGDPNLEYLSDGITENIINSLSRLPRLKVMARATVFRYKGQEADPIKVGHDLKVGAMLTGRVVQQGNNLTVNVDLMNVADGSQLWGEKYDRKLSDIFAVQEEIARQISDKLRLKLTGEEQQQLSKRYTENAEAYRAFLLGRFFWERRTEDGMKKGIQHFQQAIDSDPSYALAYVGLADCYLILYDYGFLSPQESAPKARAAATKALEIDDTLAEAHASLAYFKFSYEWDWPGAEAEFRRAIELSPNYATAHHWYGYYLAVRGRFDESLAEMRRGEEIDPLSLIIKTNIGRLLFWERKYDLAIAQFKSVLEMDPNFASASEKLAEAYEAKQMYPEAIAEYQKWAALVGDGELAAQLGPAYAASGYKGAITKWIEHLGQTREQDYTQRAMLHAAVGDKEQAFLWLGKAYNARSTWLYQLRVAPVFDGLRSDARFADLQKRIGLE